MIQNQNRIFIFIGLLFVFFALLGCGDDDDDSFASKPLDDDDDDDDDNDNDVTDDDDDDDNDSTSCGPEELCEKQVTECGEEWSGQMCLDWYDNEANCLAMPFFVKCMCFCIDRPDCDSFFACKAECLEDYCPDEATLPEDPPVPGIPGQKEMPPTLAYELSGGTTEATIIGGGLKIRVKLDPFSFTVIRQSDGEALLQSASRDSTNGFAPIAFTKNIGIYWNQFYWGYRGYAGIDLPWAHSQRGLFYWQEDDRVHFLVVSDKPDRGEMLFSVGPFYENAVRIAASAVPGKEKIDRLAFTFDSPDDEHYVGFGERFNRIDQRGTVVPHWNEEGSIEPGSLRPYFEMINPDLPAEWALPGGEHATYAAIPFYLSSKGYGLLADVPYSCSFDLASTHDDKFRLMVEADQLSAVVFAGPTPADALYQYTERTGRSQTPRKWMLAPWNMFVGYPGINWLTVAERFREEDIPTSVTHSWTNITPNGSFRGNEASILANNAYLHSLGYKSLGYLQPRVDFDRWSEKWNEGAGLDHFTREAGGDPYIQSVIINLVHMTKFNISHVDFTHSGVDDWWHELLQIQVDLDYDGTMYDFGEYIPPDSWFADGNNGEYWHNPYPLIYQRAGYNFYKTLDDDPDDGLAPDWLYFVRSAYAGSQNWTYAMWSGDPEADWSVSDGLPAQVCGGINAGLSGMPVWGNDIGGYHAILVPAPTVELPKRWYEFGAFSGLMRDMTAAEFTQGSRILPLDAPELLAIVRRYQKLRTQLVPYIYNAAWEAHETGLPLMRAPLLYYPDDPQVWNIKREYFFGPDIYVAPVVEEGATQRTLYLPEGDFVELWALTEYDETSGGFRLGGTPIEGGRFITVDAPIDEIPLFVKMGAAIPLVDAAVDTFSAADPPKEVEVTTAEDLAHLLHVWIFAKGTSSTILADDTELTVEESGNDVLIQRSGAADDKELIAQVIWPEDFFAPASVTSCSFVSGADPLSLAPGEWTWSSERNAVAFHGTLGQQYFEILSSK